MITNYKHIKEHDIFLLYSELLEQVFLCFTINYDNDWDSLIIECVGNSCKEQFLVIELPQTFVNAKDWFIARKMKIS